MCIESVLGSAAGRATDKFIDRVLNRLFPPKVVVRIARTVAPGTFGPSPFTEAGRNWTTLRIAIALEGDRSAIVERAGVRLRGGRRIYAEPGDRIGDDLPATLCDERRELRIDLRPSFELRCGDGDLVPFAELADGRVVLGEALRRE